ncbi:hypothetical protein AMJ57_02320 [Parcubacteria bacterium SG8_24]|nr:MAG: hypothetical protein AMJ57_02320 [Parcubacteria bacterium SG8_24]
MARGGPFRPGSLEDPADRHDYLQVDLGGRLEHEHPSQLPPDLRTAAAFGYPPEDRLVETQEDDRHRGAQLPGFTVDGLDGRSQVFDAHVPLQLVTFTEEDPVLFGGSEVDGQPERPLVVGPFQDGVDA